MRDGCGGGGGCSSSVVVEMAGWKCLLFIFLWSSSGATVVKWCAVVLLTFLVSRLFGCFVRNPMIVQHLGSFHIHNSWTASLLMNSDPALTFGYG